MLGVAQPVIARAYTMLGHMIYHTIRSAISIGCNVTTQSGDIQDMP